MLIPYGHDQAIRRVPWATLVIVAVNFALFAVTRVGLSHENVAALDQVEQRLASLQATIYRDHVRSVGDARDAARAAGTALPAEPLAWDEFLKALESGNLAVAHPAQLEVWREAKARLEVRISRSPDVRLDLVFGPGFKPYTLLTHLFMHMGWLHIVFNMYFLLLCAPPLEYRWGIPAFLVLYLGGGIVAALSMIPFTMGTDAHLLGASGAVAACMGAFAVRHWGAKVKFFYFRWSGFNSARWGELWMPAWLLIGLWLVGELMQASVQAVSHVAHWAHVGGFGFGVATAFVARATGWERRLFDGRILRGERPAPEDADTDLALEMAERAAWRDAAAFAARALGKHPGHPLLIAIQARALAHLGDPDQARAALASAIAKARSTGPTEHLLGAARQLGERLQTLGLDPRAQHTLAQWLEDDGTPEDALWVYRDLAESHPSHPLAPKALYRVADLERATLSDRPAAAASLRKFLDRYPDHPLAVTARSALAELAA